MLPDNNIQNELKELNSSLFGIPVKNVYTVPRGYFEDLTNNILKEISPNYTLNAQDAVPEGYFDGLADSIMSKIRASEQEAAESHVSGISRKNVYTVPDGYFESLAENILRKLPKTAPVKSMKPVFSVFRYAVAAVITGLIGLMVISILDKNVTENKSGEQVILAQANNILSSGSFDKVMSSVTDEEIVHYLEMNGEDIDAALVASLADDQSLPEAVEYFTDDKALDKLLEGLTN